jgi:hypothetical protein
MATDPGVFSVSVILAAIGGASVNLLNLMELQNVPKERRPDFKDWLYWLPYLIWPLLGGVVAFMYQQADAPLTKTVAFHVGASAPLIIRSMANVIPAPARPTDPGA